MKSLKRALLGACALALAAGAARAASTTLTIATVNNGDMVRMQKLTDDFTKANPDIKLNWVTLEENDLRQKVTKDIATKGGQYDVLTIGTYETPIWGKKGWLVPLTGVDDPKDLLPAIAGGLTVDGKLYASPFYGESSYVMYRKDLMAKAGLKMPDAPTWDFIAQAAAKMTDRKAGINGICLRGKAGWGENMAFLTAMSNSFGARWFNMKWKPQFDQPEWKATLNFYLKMMKDSGPPGASGNGFSENLALFQTGKCGMWIDATVAGSFVTDPKASKVADKVGFALAPDKGLGKRGNWLWAWSLAIPAGTKHVAEAQKFVGWATSKHYLDLVAAKDGWANVPPGTRASLYANPNYAKVPFAKMTLDSINAADPTHPTVKRVPYVGVQFVAIPEFQGIGTKVGELFSAALAGQMSADDALKQAQAYTTAEMTKAGYIK
ncbi:MAG: sugar ABC transporter substrate-binding protein [Hyphomicrobiales bacterium]|nr:sugar ABC transporter substrate-binding protein [Hyphomicrobiales bacterium]MDE2017221.1 sugar ABC transporter substrate-binding protein [Hyphomicrobiales bacterium]